MSLLKGIFGPSQEEIWNQFANEIGGDFPDGADEPYFQTTGVIKDVERFNSLYMLFALILNKLCLIGSAYEDDPEVT